MVLDVSALGFYSFRGPLRNTNPGDWVAHRLAWINDTNDVNSVADLTAWVFGTTGEIVSTNNGTGGVILSLGPNILSWVTVPVNASDPGTAGAIAYDTSYLYVCIATNTWKRTGLSTWTIDRLLLETGDALLLEIGDDPLLE